MAIKGNSGGAKKREIIEIAWKWKQNLMKFSGKCFHISEHWQPETSRTFCALNHFLYRGRSDPATSVTILTPR